MPHDRLCRYCWNELDPDRDDDWCSDRCRRRDQTWNDPTPETVDTAALERAGQQKFFPT